MLPVLFCMSDSVRWGSFLLLILSFFFYLFLNFFKECKFHVNFLRPVLKKINIMSVPWLSMPMLNFIFTFWGAACGKDTSLLYNPTETFQKITSTYLT